MLDMRVAFSAPKHVDDVISRLGRTEDIRFSPDNKRLAVAEFSNNAIAIFDIEIEGIARCGSVPKWRPRNFLKPTQPPARD